MISDKAEKERMKTLMMVNKVSARCEGKLHTIALREEINKYYRETYNEENTKKSEKHFSALLRQQKRKKSDCLLMAAEISTSIGGLAMFVGASIGFSVSLNLLQLNYEHIFILIFAGLFAFLFGFFVLFTLAEKTYKKETGE